MKTIQERFQRYVSLCFENDPPQAQLAAIRMAWFAASFEILNLLLNEVAELPDDEAEKALKRCADESRRVCKELAATSRQSN